MDLEEIQKHLDKVMHEQNRKGRAEFEGYSPDEMHRLLHHTFVSGSPVSLKKMSEVDYQKIPLLNQIKYFLNEVDRLGEVKLTARGFLPTKLVKSIYQQGFLKDEMIERGISKLYKETDALTINLTRILAEMSGLVKKRKSKLSLTKKAKDLLSNDPKLLRLIFLVFSSKFNWAFYDGYGENHIGQLGFAFSMILLSKYGGEKRLDSFYGSKYFNAFPNLLNSIEPAPRSKEERGTRCYSVRSFERFLFFFGLIEIEEEGRGYPTIQYITKTDLFDKLIYCDPPKGWG